MYAVLLSWGAILLYLWFRFGNWTFGAAAVICLIHDLFFTLGIIAVCHYIHNWWPVFLGIEDFKIDLTAVAALLTLVGYSVNDTIVVFDRIRENLALNRREKLADVVNRSINQTLSRTVIASGLTFLTVLCLYVFGGEVLNGFSFALVVGILIGTYSSIAVAAPMLVAYQEWRGKKAPAGKRVVLPAAKGARR